MIRPARIPSTAAPRLAVLGAASVLLLCFLVVTGSSALFAQDSADPATTNDAESTAPDWPQFRGPNGDGKSQETGIDTDWGANGPKIAWRRDLGKGFSGLTAVAGVLYTQYSNDGAEHLVALSAADGKEVWSLRLDDERRDQFGDGPRATPTYDAGGLLYAVSALGHLVAVQPADGKVVWEHELVDEYGAQVPTWGISASPVVVDDLLLFDVGGKDGYLLAGFDKATGDVRWHAGKGLPGYSLPLTIEVGGVRQTIFFTGDAVVSVDPADGTIHWREAWKTAYDVNAAAPVFVPPHRIFVSSGYDTGASLLELDPKAPTKAPRTVWSSRRMKNQFSSSVYHEGHIYGFDNNALKCIDAETGADRWRKSGFGHGSLFLVGDLFVVLGDNGKLAVFEANAEAYVEKASTQVARGKHWTVPTLYDGKLFVRNEKELIAYEVDRP